MSNLVNAAVCNWRAIKGLKLMDFSDDHSKTNAELLAVAVKAGLPTRGKAYRNLSDDRPTEMMKQIALNVSPKVGIPIAIEVIGWTFDVDSDPELGDPFFAFAAICSSVEEIGLIKPFIKQAEETFEKWLADEYKITKPLKDYTVNEKDITGGIFVW